MRIDDIRGADDPKLAAWCFVCAGALAAQLFALGSLSFELLEPWDKIFHCLACASLTLLLWLATDGRRPLLVTVGVMMLALVDELRQGLIATRSADIGDFLAGAFAAGITGIILFKMRGKACAESSPR